MKANEYIISDEKFVLAKRSEAIHDKELETKPMSYFQDAFKRFKKNKASIVAAIIIGILVLFALLAPFCTPYEVASKDTAYAYCLPKAKMFEKTNFWDGCSKKTNTQEQFIYYYSQGMETGHNAVKNQYYTTEDRLNAQGKMTRYYTYRLDSYQQKGVIFRSFTRDEYLALQEYQNRTSRQVIYPYTSSSSRPTATQDNRDANYWFKTKMVNGKSVAVLSDSKDITSLINIYQPYSGINSKTNEPWDLYNSIRVEGDTPLYDYAQINQTGFECRINYYEYYIYYHTQIAKDGITEPCFIFGATQAGADIFVSLASGARFSFLLAIVVASVNLFVGAIYGAIEGYYGGKIDLTMERISDILSAVPFMIVITLLKYHLKVSQVVIVFIAFFLTGWIGMASTTRMQFYRFKNQEYVLAARTLGASDKRIMFKHIFPNALGTLVTSCVLVIPGVIFSETSLSYLGIINLDSGNMTSVGTLLSNAQPYLVQFPHMIAFPAIFISLLELSFNLFGNGLRDAFNPSLRGSED